MGCFCKKRKLNWEAGDSYFLPQQAKLQMGQWASCMYIYILIYQAAGINGKRKHKACSFNTMPHLLSLLSMCVLWDFLILLKEQEEKEGNGIPQRIWILWTYSYYYVLEFIKEGGIPTFVFGLLTFLFILFYFCLKILFL